MKRAALIITDADALEVLHVVGNLNQPPLEELVDVPEGLLADLRTLVRFPGAPDIPPVSAEAIQDARDRKVRAVDAAARVRALLPEEDEDAE